MRTTLLVASLLLVGCTISEENYPDAIADAMCDRINQCTDEFESDEDRESCESFWAVAAEAQVDLVELFGGEYNPEEGAACVREIRSVSCADFNSTEIDCDVFAE